VRKRGRPWRERERVRRVGNEFGKEVTGIGKVDFLRSIWQGKRHGKSMRY